MKKLIILLIFISTNLLSQIDNSTIVVDFDIIVNGNKNQAINYDFEFDCKSFNIKHNYKIESEYLSCNLITNKKYSFKFNYKNYKPVIVNLSTDTINKKRITIPIYLNEQTIRKTI